MKIKKRIEIHLEKFFLDDLKNINQVAIDILNIAEDLCTKKPLNIETLYKTAVKKLNYPNEEINKTIYDLLLKKIIIPEKKLIRTQVLKNEKRQLIFDFVRGKPGSHLREIRENLGLNPHVAQVHLKILEGFNFLYRKKHLKYVVFFPFDFVRKNEDSILALKNEKAERIFSKIFQEQEVDFEGLKEIEDIDIKAINYHLEPLISSGLVIKTERDGKELFQLNQDKYLMIERYIEKKVERKKEIPLREPLPAEILKPVALEAPRLPISQESKDLIEIKREYDFVGGEIRFKAAIRNISNTVVTDINVTLIPTSQYEIVDRLKVVDILRPGESRGVDFYLTPLTCGQSKVFGSISYMDPFGNPQTATISPKDIWIKCPLVIPKTSSIDEIEKVKKQLQKGETKISFKIDQTSAFNIVLDQISALDLSEIKVDENNFTTIHSGLAKVTNDNMIIESKIEGNHVVLIVWTRDMKQATGFLAYIKNLILMTFESHSKLEGKIEKISQKILDTDEIFKRLITLFDYCDNRDDWKIGDILILINEIKSKMERSIPGSSIIIKMKDWIEDLGVKREGDSLNEKPRNDLEYDIITWISELNRIGCNQLEIYQSSFPEKKIQIENLCTLTNNQEEQLSYIEKKYVINILQYIMVIAKGVGLSIYQFDFTTGSEVDPDLISGFLTAIQDFGMEISRGEDTLMKKLAYKNFQIELDDGEYTKVALILKGEPIEFIMKRLKSFIVEFEGMFKENLGENFMGNVQVFKDAETLVKKNFS
ncbi:MAG: hypothetical protein EAX96_02010 [Candidatus Lokiarchaeota archaeon]|nr:hypothetical protein [Candidatus Lokiarchaeota archaeon]